MDRDDALRAVKVASLSDEAKDAAREEGLDDNRTALLDAARFSEPGEQVLALRNKNARRNRLCGTERPGKRVGIETLAFEAR